jgi:alanine dehydrogenase
MIVGVPKGIKPDEYRVAVVPAGVEQLKRAGHTILVEHGAASGMGIKDEDCQVLGAAIIDSPKTILAEAELICNAE